MRTRAVTVLQLRGAVSNGMYLVVKVTNSLTPRCNEVLSPTAIQDLINRGFKVTIVPGRD